MLQPLNHLGGQGKQYPPPVGTALVTTLPFNHQGEVNSNAIKSPSFRAMYQPDKREKHANQHPVHIRIF
jgi:hypothetical protein